MTSQLHVAALVMATVLLVYVAKRRGVGFKALRGRIGFGAAFLALGLYVFPLGTLEAYAWTQQEFALDTSQNALLWYTASTVLMLLGAAFMVGGRH